MTATLLDHPYIVELIGIRLPIQDFVIAGSGPLLARGWLEDIGDIDVVARGEAWSRAVDLGVPSTPEFADLPESEGVTAVTVPGTHVEVFNGWFPRLWTVDELIDDAELYLGLPFVPLSVVIETKRLLGRPTDREHLDLIEECLEVESGTRQARKPWVHPVPVRRGRPT